jgi:metal-sulfur cluster biosynthetic enzyme
MYMRRYVNVTILKYRSMSLTAIGCPVGPQVMAEVEDRVREVPGVESCAVTLTYDPPWTPDRMSDDAKWELGIA